MDRLKKQEYDKFVELSQNYDNSFQQNYLINGIKNLDNHNSTLATVMDYYNNYKNKLIKPSDIIKKTLNTIQKWENEQFFIFSYIKTEEVMKQAYESDKRWALNQPLSVFDGVPVAFKDMMDIKDHIVYEGRNRNIKNKQFFKNATKDDTIVARFRNVGAIIIGLTIMTEGGTSPLGYNSHFKGPVSPYHINRYSGGSSSGSAVAVATGLVPVSIGFDGGGSIRIPASMSGIHAIATTFGR